MTRGFLSHSLITRLMASGEEWKGGRLEEGWIGIESGIRDPLIFNLSRLVCHFIGFLGHIVLNLTFRSDFV